MSQYIRDSTSGPDVKWTEERCLKEAASILRIFSEDKDMVFYKEAILDKDYSWQAIMEGCKRHKGCQELSRLFNRLKDIHETRLVKRGLTKKHSDGMTKLVLQNVHGREDKKHVESRTNITVEGILDDIIE